jgi:hypothetical protein
MKDKRGELVKELFQKCRVRQGFSGEVDWSVYAITDVILAREQRLQDRIDEAVMVLEEGKGCGEDYYAIHKALEVLKGEL